jgi:hypothetical protein
MILLPIGLLRMAWTSPKSVPWAAQVCSGVLVGAGVELNLYATTAYFIDVYQLHSNSAMSGFMRPERSRLCVPAIRDSNVRAAECALGDHSPGFAVHGSGSSAISVLVVWKSRQELESIQLQWLIYNDSSRRQPALAACCYSYGVCCWEASMAEV